MATELWQQGDYHAALRGLQSETGESSLATLQVVFEQRITFDVGLLGLWSLCSHPSVQLLLLT